MIKTTIEYICDKCGTDVKEGGKFFKIKRDDVVTNRIESATNYMVHHDGISLYSLNDKYTAYHLCEPCMSAVESFIMESTI